MNDEKIPLFSQEWIRQQDKNSACWLGFCIAITFLKKYIRLRKQVGNEESWETVVAEFQRNKHFCEMFKAIGFPSPEDTLIIIGKMYNKVIKNEADKISDLETLLCSGS